MYFWLITITYTHYDGVGDEMETKETYDTDASNFTAAMEFANSMVYLHVPLKTVKAEITIDRATRRTF